MAKIALSTEKYIIHARLEADGVVEKPDIVGAIFGQTEGLLGDELELRELQKGGRVGRIDVKVKTAKGKTTANIQVPSSLSKEETALIAAALETIQRIGPCESRVQLERIEDVRAEKRQFIEEAAKNILRSMIDTGTQSSELSARLKQGTRAMKISKYGPDKLPAGPDIAKSDAIIVVEGRADVVNLLKNGINNVVSMEGTTVPASLAKLTKRKTTTIFIDGDRGGELILKKLSQIGKVDYIARAPSGKEVEELTQKEILQCLRGKGGFPETGAKEPVAPKGGLLAPYPRAREPAAPLKPEAEVRSSFSSSGSGDSRSYGSRSEGDDRRSYGSRGSSDSRSYGSRDDRRSYSSRDSSDSRSYGSRDDRRSYGSRDDSQSYRSSGSSDRRGFRSSGSSDRRSYRPRGDSDRRGFRQSGGSDRRGFRSRGDRDDRMRRPPPKLPDSVREEMAPFKKIFQGIQRTNMAVLLGKKQAVISNDVPVSQLLKVMRDLGTDVDAIVFDGIITQEIVDLAETKHINILLGYRRAYKRKPLTVSIYTAAEL